MYPNLRAEMARYNIKTIDIVKVLNISPKSVRNKMSGKTPFTIPEAITLRNKLFPGMSLDFLFAEKINKLKVSGE
jgi:hypothetical protein